MGLILGCLPDHPAGGGGRCGCQAERVGKPAANTVEHLHPITIRPVTVNPGINPPCCTGSRQNVS
jgi:hypothetical protein